MISICLTYQSSSEACSATLSPLPTPRPRSMIFLQPWGVQREEEEPPPSLAEKRERQNESWRGDGRAEEAKRSPLSTDLNPDQG
ncbi:hypothetical protein [Paenibacillus sp. SN-8-1]|uniref:hypothetical protein n=1 Tax=Paenibacillus sp. SN-8-1 TaxID=3435409 RepID=UPI003D9A0DCA